MGCLSIPMYINKLLYKGFIYETEQPYTNVCRKCMSNNTSIQKKKKYILCIANFKQNEQDGNQTTQIPYRLMT